MKHPGLLQGFVAFASGLSFGGGLLLSGMTQPKKVLGFLDVLGEWDASLAFVMLGAIGVHAVAYRLIRGRPAPLLARAWSLPTRRGIDVQLLGGAALFGVGWGLGGYCPGPAVVSLASGALPVIVFILAMLVGMLVIAQLEKATNTSAQRWVPGSRCP